MLFSQFHNIYAIVEQSKWSQYTAISLSNGTQLTSNNHISDIGFSHSAQWGHIRWVTRWVKFFG